MYHNSEGANGTQTLGASDCITLVLIHQGSWDFRAK